MSADLLQAAADKAEALGLIADRLDNLAAALSMPMPDDLHVKCLRAALPGIGQEIRDLLEAA